jgi:hypothetical protein
MVRALVGDSTMTRVDILACKVRGNQKNKRAKLKADEMPS